MINVTLPYRAPDFVVLSPETVAPAAAQVLADSGPRQVGYSDSLMIAVTLAGDDSVPAWEIAVRDVTNTIDESVIYIGAPQAPGVFSAVVNIQTGQRVVVRAKTAGTAAKTYQASLYGWNL